MIGLYDTEDACAKYTQDCMITSCKNGYMTAQDTKLLNTIPSLVEAYRNSTPFKIGSHTGAVEANMTNASPRQGTMPVSTHVHDTTQPSLYNSSLPSR